MMRNSIKVKKNSLYFLMLTAFVAIAGTALVVYRNSLLQLNHYHKALHEDERFLSSVNLLGKFSTVEVQDDMLREIIRSEIQMNLAITQENEKNQISQV